MTGRTLIAVPLLSVEAVPGPALLHLSDYDRQIPLSGYAWLYRAAPQSAWTLIDTGTESPDAVNASRSARRQWQWRPLTPALAQHGVALEDVADVVLTHLHHDHCASIERFPAARWHVPAAEWAFVNDPASADLAPDPVFPRHLFPRMASHGVLALADSDEPVAGLRVRHVGGHTVGSLIVEILDRSGELQIVLGGDVMPLYENLSRSIPPGTLWHWGECRRALQRLAAYRAPVLPSHDPQVMREYPEGVILHG